MPRTQQHQGAKTKKNPQQDSISRQTPVPPRPTNATKDCKTEEEAKNSFLARL